MIKLILSSLIVYALYSTTNITSTLKLSNDGLDTCIAHIKYHEGFRSKIYSDESGNKFIGYGHYIKAGESYNSITKSQAETLLKQDFEKIKLKVAEFCPKLTGNKLNAMTAFSYNVGPYYFLGSKVCKAIKADKSIDSILVKYCSIVRTNNTVQSKKLLARRKFELWLYNYNQ